MAFEVQAWKIPDCTLTFKTGELSQRASHSDEINQTFGGGGALNASYRTADAIAKVANKLGVYGLVIDVDFIFKTGSEDTIVFDFADEGARDTARDALSEFIIA